VITKAVPHSGGRVRGLVEYLFGPGRAEEHTDPQVVAAYEPILVGDRGETALGRKMLAAELDYPRKNLRPDVSEKFVFHGVVSVGAEEGRLSGEQWSDIATTITDHLGFNPEDGGAGVRWIAVHHGLSAQGNDHIHVMANLINEDGRKHKFIRPPGVMMGEVRPALEIKHGLTLVGHDKSRGLGDYTQAELRRGQEERQAVATAKGVALAQVPTGEPETVRLERRVRAAASAASGEGDFLARLREQRVLVRPRYATGDSSTVVGMSVALPSVGDGQKLIWHGAGRLAKDLALPRLRAQWGDGEHAQAAAIGAWREFGSVSKQRHDHQGSRPREATSADFTAAVADIDKLGAFAATIGAGDPAAAREAAREAAAVLSAAALRTHGRAGGAVGDAARRMARCAQPGSAQPALKDVIPARTAVPRMSTASALLINAATGKSQHAGWVAVIHSLARTAQSVAAAQRATRASAWEIQAATEAAEKVLAFAGRMQGAVAAAGTGATELTDEQRRVREVMAGRRTHTVGEYRQMAADTPARIDRAGMDKKPETGQGPHR
jgi:hypothetical protein